MNTQLQKIFSYAVPKLLEQNKRSYSMEAGHCLYRHGNLKCLIGHCITDKAFLSELGGDQDLGVSSPVVKKALTDSGFPNDTVSDVSLTNLQMIHDQHRPDEWAELLKIFASKNNLTYPKQGVIQ